MNMTPSLSSPDSSTPASPAREEAAAWFARVRAGALDPAQQEALAHWRAASAANEHEYRALERIWDLAGRMDPERLLALAEEAPRASARKPGRWRHAGAAMACALLLGVAVGGYQWHRAQPVFAGEARTALGERKSVPLPDGSSVDVNTGTQLQVRYYRDRRVVELAAGEATFSVNPDAQRPFIVEAGSGSVKVTGTRFNVRRDGGEVAVAVLSGRVEVSGTAPGARAPAMLTAGLAVRVDGAGSVGEVRRTDVAALTAWRDGKLVFDDAPLAEVLRELSRYSAKPIRLADTRVGQMRLSSTFRVNDTDALLEALPRILPVQVGRLPDGSAEISAR